MVTNIKANGLHMDTMLIIQSDLAAFYRFSCGHPSKFPSIPNDAYP